MCKGGLVVPGSTDRRLLARDDFTDETATTRDASGSAAVNISSSQEDLLSAVKSELESPSRGSWLLILDNLTEETAAAKLLPQSPNRMIIVTTRSLHLASRLSYRPSKYQGSAPLTQRYSSRQNTATQKSQ